MVIQTVQDFVNTNTALVGTRGEREKQVEDVPKLSHPICDGVITTYAVIIYSNSDTYLLTRPSHAAVLGQANSHIAAEVPHLAFLTR